MSGILSTLDLSNVLKFVFFSLSISVCMEIGIFLVATTSVVSPLPQEEFHLSSKYLFYLKMPIYRSRTELEKILPSRMTIIV